MRRLIRQEGVVARFDGIDDLPLALNLTYFERNEKGRAEYQPIKNQTIAPLEARRIFLSSTGIDSLRGVPFLWQRP